MLTSSSPTRLLLVLASGLSSLACGNGSAESSADEPAAPSAAIEVSPPAPASDPATAASGQDGSDDTAPEAIDEGAPASTDRDAASRCLPPEGTSGAPGNVDELLALLNALPRPTSLACFLESLDRPLDLFLTRSKLSAQPASGPENPRTFIVIGDLTLTVVPSGRTRSLLELGYASAPGRSIKGEVEFPLRGLVTTDTISERVALNRGTTCGTCHLRESDVSEAHYEGAYESDQRDPFLGYEVDIESLREQSASCDPELDAERCEILGALFDHGEVRRTSRWSAEGEYAPSESDAGAAPDAGLDAAVAMSR